MYLWAYSLYILLARKDNYYSATWKHGACAKSRFLQIPLEIAIRETSDSGAPIAASSPKSPSALAYHRIATRLKEKLFDPTATRITPSITTE